MGNVLGGRALVQEQFNVFGDDSQKLPGPAKNHTYYQVRQLVVCSPFPFCPERLLNHGPRPCSGR